MSITQTYNYLGHDDTIINIALLAGFIHALKCSDFLEFPLSSTCLAIIVAIIYSCIASLIVGISPDLIKPFLSIILIMSIAYYILFKRTCNQSVCSITIIEKKDETDIKN
jgi:hypothetical protein